MQNPKQERYAGLGFPIDLFPKRASAWEDYDDKEMKDTRKRGRRQKKPNDFNKRERERERANGSLSALFTHFFSELVILALVSSKKRAKREGNYP